MRVISGTHKGRAFKAVPGMKTRPTTDKVKESLFNIIGPYFSGGVGVDLFAGSGGLGIEALSRGLDKVIFIDKSNQAVKTIKQNLEQLSLTSQAEVYRNEAKRALQLLAKRGVTCTYIFLDPPYYNHELISILEEISNKGLLAKNGLIVVEHAHDAHLPDVVKNLEKTRGETYGVTKLTFYKWGKDKE